MRQSVLLVEDDSDFAAMVAALLPDCTIKHVNTAALAQLWLNQGFRTDVVFLDLGLPDSDGIETVIRIAETAQNIPVIVLTGSNESNLLERVRQAGAQDYIDKAQIRGGYWLQKAMYYAMVGKYQTSQWAKDRKTWGAMLKMQAEISIAIQRLMIEAISNDMAYQKLYKIYSNVVGK
jgi:CheY-like chemotaxis protein